MNISKKELKSKAKADSSYESEEFNLEIADPGKKRKEKLFFLALLVLTALASFGLGRLSFYEKNKEPLEIKFSQGAASAPSVLGIETKPGQPETGIKESGGAVVGSKNSNKYHYPWCSGAKRISEANKITFASIEEAKTAGYSPAGNCKGLQ